MSTPKKPTSGENSSKTTSLVGGPNEIIGFGVPEDSDYMDTVSYDLAYLMTHLISAISPRINQGVTFDLLYGMFAHEEGIDEHIAIETGLLIGASHTVPASRETH
jgi:hypothetical protein